MVEISAGSFMMGSSVSESGSSEDEVPRHKVQIKRFALSRDEVTFHEYGAFVRATGHRLPDAHSWGYGRQPVIDVSWQDATAYAEWLSQNTGQRYRLPSEAEWEYAARAGTKTACWWGEDIREDGTVWANCSVCGSKWDGKQTSPVGAFRANPFGLYDTAGNVSEWVQDCYQDSYEAAPTDGSAVLSGHCAEHVIRGGSWLDGRGRLRSANRFRFSSVSRSNDVGFRLAKDLP